MPSLERIERHPDPKTLLHDLLRTASGLSGVRRKRFDVHTKVHRVAEHIKDLTAHRRLEAFRRFDTELREILPAVLGSLQGPS